MGFRQTVIRYEDPDKGRIVREVVHYAESDIDRFEIMGKPAIRFKSQLDGNFNILHTDLIVEAFIEEENQKYGTFRKVDAVHL